MNALTEAVFFSDRDLAQHQAALTLLRQLTQNPKINDIHWLDLACGRGQILSNIPKIIPADRRNKINYTGIDVSKEFALKTENLAKGLFKNARVEICNLCYFEKILKQRELFDIVTCTNAVHEVSPEELAETLTGAICRTKRKGFLYLYDMEVLPKPELGAIPWNGKEMEQVLHDILLDIGVSKESLPDVAIWNHSSCTCWNIQLHIEHLRMRNINKFRNQMKNKAVLSMQDVLKNKLLEIHLSLNTAANYPSDETEDKECIIKLLHNYWAVSRAIGAPLNLSMASN